MLRILIIGLGNPAPTFISRRLKALLSHGAQITVIAQRGQALDLPGATIIRVTRKLNVKSIIQSLLNAFLHPHIFLKMIMVKSELSFTSRLGWTLKYLSVMLAKSPDVIHLQWLGAVPEFIWLRKFFACPIMASARGSMLTVYPITRPGYRNLIEQAIQQVDYIHCVSEDLAKICEKFGAKREQIITNYNGVDLRLFNGVLKTGNNEMFKIITVGALMWRKGMLFQLLILKALVDKAVPTRLVIVGDGPDREGLIYLAYIMGLEKSVDFVGKIEGDLLVEHLNNSDLYLSTSVAEGLPNSVVEATACGLPVVAFECEGIRAIIDEGVSGFILQVGDIAGIIQKIIELWKNAELRKSMGIEGMLRVKSRFDQENTVLDMILCYQQVVEKFRGRAL